MLSLSRFVEPAQNAVTRRSFTLSVVPLVKSAYEKCATVRFAARHFFVQVTDSVLLRQMEAQRQRDVQAQEEEQARLERAAWLARYGDDTAQREIIEIRRAIQAAREAQQERKRERQAY